MSDTVWQIKRKHENKKEETRWRRWSQLIEAVQSAKQRVKSRVGQDCIAR